MVEKSVLVGAQDVVGITSLDNRLEVIDLVKAPKLSHELQVRVLVVRVGSVGAPGVHPV